jgi:hypothetical protein
MGGFGFYISEQWKFESVAANAVHQGMVAFLFAFIASLIVYGIQLTRFHIKERRENTAKEESPFFGIEMLEKKTELGSPHSYKKYKSPFEIASSKDTEAEEQ